LEKINFIYIINFNHLKTTLIIKFGYIIWIYLFVTKQKWPEQEKPNTKKEFLTELREFKRNSQ